MKTRFFPAVMLMLMFSLVCNGVETENHTLYKSFSSLTDPGGFSAMLDKLPGDVTGICEIAKGQTVHHNLLPYYNIPKSKWKEMSRVWPPKMTRLLETLKKSGPHNLYDNRKIEQRIIGACVLESHFLTGMLRYKGVPARIRAGYFKDVRANGPYVVKFWEKTLRVRGVNGELLKTDPKKWREEINAFTSKKNAANHYIEHWICQYWDENKKKWRLLDANNTFLEASSNIKVGFHLPKTYYEYAHESWKKMRSKTNFNPDQYAEWPQDGRSHIRSQLLSDFFSLLNHDAVGFNPLSGDAKKFIKEKKYEEVSTKELEELDRLANLLSKEPAKDELVAFYRNSKTLRIKSVEKDPYCFLFGK